MPSIGAIRIFRRKLTEKFGDIIDWDTTTVCVGARDDRVKGIHRLPLPNEIYGKYMKYWGGCSTSQHISKRIGRIRTVWTC